MTRSVTCACLVYTSWQIVDFIISAACSALVCEQEREGDGHVVLVGLGSGQIQEFRLSRDLNRFERRKTFPSKIPCILETWYFITRKSRSELF